MYFCRCVFQVGQDVSSCGMAFTDPATAITHQAMQHAGSKDKALVEKLNKRFYPDLFDPVSFKKLKGKLGRIKDEDLVFEW